MEKKILAPMLVATLAHLATRYKTNWDAAKEQVQNVIDLYTATGLPAMNSKDLHDLFNNTEEMLYGKMTGGEAAHLKIGKGEGTHLPINKKAAMEMISKPEGYNELLEGIKQCNKICLAGFEPNSAANVRFGATAIKDRFVIDESGTLQLSETVQKEIAEAGRVYATSEKGQAVYKFLQMVNDAFFECGLHEFWHAHLGTIKGEKIGEVIGAGIKEISITDKTFVPMIQGGFSPFPKLPFDYVNPSNPML